MLSSSCNNIFMWHSFTIKMKHKLLADQRADRAEMWRCIMGIISSVFREPQFVSETQRITESQSSGLKPMETPDLLRRGTLLNM